MKKVAREVYIALSNEALTNLCTFCYYDKGSCYDDACAHPFIIISEDDLGLSPGADCWGFRNSLPVRDIADIVGIVLAHHFWDWAWLMKDDKQIKIYGEVKI